MGICLELRALFLLFLSKFHLKGILNIDFIKSAKLKYAFDLQTFYQRF